MNQDEVAEVFGLGTPTQAARRLHGGSSGRVWELRTTGGHWVVKTQSGNGDWRRCQMRRAHALESAAHSAGLALPRPLAPPEPSVGYWHALSGAYARVVTFLDDARPVRTPTGPQLADWLGRTLAAIEHLALPGDLADDAATPLHPLTDWRQWTAEARTSEVADTARELLPAVERATRLVRAAEATGPDVLLAHRDVGPANVLIGDAGFALVDWDHGGPAVPWWEAVHTAFRFAGGLDDGAVTDPDAVRRVLAAHRDAGGTQGPADASAFAGMLRATLGFTAYTLWLTLGHRGGDAEDRGEAAVRFRDAAASVHRALAALPEWCALLR